MAKPKTDDLYYPNTLIRKRNRELEQERQEEKPHKGKEKEGKGAKEDSAW